MRTIVQWALRNSPAMNTMVIALLIVGAVSFIVMRREVFPEFELEIVLVSAAYPGATAEETESGICEKIEAAVSGIDGLKQYTSVAREGFGFVIVELNANVRDVQKVLNDIRTQVDQITGLPDSVERPDVRQIVFKIPAIQLGIIGPDNSELDELTQQLYLREIAEKVREDLLQLPAAKPENFLRRMFHSYIAPPGRNAISSADIVAARDFQIDVEVPEQQLRNYGLSMRSISNALRLHNSEIPGGKMETAGQEMLLRGRTRRELGEEISQIPVVTLPNGDVVFLRDIAKVVDGFTDSTSHHRVDGKPAAVINVARTADEDLFTVVDTVKEYAANKVLPAGYRIKLWQDVSLDVRDRVDLLTRNGIQGLILVFVVLALFLDMRLAFWVALGIPVAVIGSGLVLLMFGATLNMLSMFAVLMALGIVVDDAIVVGENIYHKRQAGLGPIDAAIEGTVEVLPSVTASVLTTIIAVAPLFFVAGVMGKFIAVMPLAIIAMLSISLIESVVVLPGHIAHEKNLFLRMICGVLYLFRPLLVPFAAINRGLGKGLDGFIERVYLPVLRWALANKPVVLCAATGLLVLSLGVLGARLVPFEAFPKIDSRNISATCVFPDGTAQWAASRATDVLAEKLDEVNREIEQEFGHVVVSMVYKKVGEIGDGGRGPTGVTDGSHVGTVEVDLTQPGDRELSSEEIIERWRKKMPELPGIDTIKFGSQSMGPGGVAIEFKLLASNDSVQFLERAVEECKAWLKGKVGVTDIEDDQRPGKYEMRLELNDEGRALGLDESSISQTVRSAYFGDEVMRLQRGRHEVKLMVRLPEEDRRSMAGFEEIRVRDNNNVERPLLDVATIDFRRANSEVNRLNGKRCITVTADFDKSEGAEVAPVIAELKDEFLPGLFRKYKSEYGATLYVNWEGQQQQTAESFSSMLSGFAVAFLAMYLLLTLEFRSYIQPMIILCIIPFGFIGAVAGHAIMGLEMTLFSMFGLITLAGVIVNDSIVLIDFVNIRLREGMSLYDSLIDAGRRRFRAVLLTTMTTVAGLFPIVLETSAQAQVVIPMAVSLVFGLMTGTALILVLVPVIFQIYGTWFRVEQKRDEFNEEFGLAEKRGQAHILTGP
jgi:hydrophobic/amphiphilic exporter-1 (mainly G- bacteria), HAE1 family